MTDPFEGCIVHRREASRLYYKDCIIDADLNWALPRSNLLLYYTISVVNGFN